MPRYKFALEILANYFPQQYAPQQTKDWHGLFLLHQDLIEYYTLFGPLDLSLPSYGNNFYLPKLANLWKYQEGYRWDRLTQEKLTDWNEEWLVIADQGADPIIFSFATSGILFDHHGQGFWQPKELFEDIEIMATCLLILSSIVIDANDALTDNEGHIKESFRQDAQNQLITLLGFSSQAKKVLSTFGWV